MTKVKLHARYPWEQWLTAASKRWVTAVRGRDFACTRLSFQMYLYKICRDRNLKVSTVLHTGRPERLSFFVYDPNRDLIRVPLRPRRDQFMAEEVGLNRELGQTLTNLPII